MLGSVEARVDARGGVVVNGVGLPTHCECGEPMSRHNITGVCAECALVARNERAAAVEAELQAQRDQRRRQAIARAIAQIDNQSRGAAP
jgi:uncharacterized Zn finger protein (UPF0148 family)